MHKMNRRKKFRKYLYFFDFFLMITLFVSLILAVAFGLWDLLIWSFGLEWINSNFNATLIAVLFIVAGLAIKHVILGLLVNRFDRTGLNNLNGYENILTTETHNSDADHPAQ